MTQPIGGDWTTAILCQLMMLISYHWLKERYCDDENDPNRVMTSLRLKDWGISADNLKKRGWSLGYVSTLDSRGPTMWIADAHRDDAKRFVVRADGK